MYLTDVRVARSHCRVQVEIEVVIVESLHGPEGVWVNGEHLSTGEARANVQIGDVIHIGNVQLRLELGEVMTESRWLACANPDEMLAFLRGRASLRKLRLFACACCRRIWERLPDACCRAAVDVMERRADEQVTPPEVQEAIAAVERVERAADGPARMAARAVATAWSTTEHSRSAAARAAAEPERERAWQAGLLREIFGNPFRPFPVPPSWPSTITALAAAFYEGEDCHYALADALMEAGYAELAEHFREAGHPKGCWALDAILVKEPSHEDDSAT